MRNSSQFGVKSICANLGGFQGFAQVRLAFSVFIALGRAPTRGVRNDEVIILRAPRQMCVGVGTVQCSALSCGSGSAPLRKSVKIDSRDCPGGRRSSALCLGLEGLDLAGFGACAPCLHVSAGCHEPLKGPLLRGFSSQKRAYEMQLSHAARALRAAPLRSRAMRARARAGLGSETRNKGKS